MVKHIQIQTQSKCNGKCFFCPYVGSWHDKNPGIMSVELFSDILKRQPDDFNLHMHLQNEPFLDPRIFDLMELAKKISKVQRFSISTNASVIPDNIERLKDFDCDLFVSFHGDNKETYERIMGLNYENAVKNIQRLNDLGFKFNIIGNGESRKKIIDGKEEVLFDQESYRNHLASLGLGSHPIEYKSYHDRAGQAKNIDFHYKAKEEDTKNCIRILHFKHYLWDGTKIICCMDYHKASVNGNREICKTCISPGG